MRTFFSAVAAIAAVVLCFVSVPALWLDRNVVQEEGFVTLTAPLGTDQQFQDSLADAAAEAVLQEIQLAPEIAQFVRPLLEGAAQSLTSHPQYEQAWAQSLRDSHRLTFADAGATADDAAADGAASGGDGALVLDIAPLAALVTSDAAAAVNADLEPPEQLPVSIGGSVAQQNIELLKRYAGLGTGFAVAAAAAFILALAMARRRSTTVALISGGVLAAACVWKLAGDFAVRELQAGGGAGALGTLFTQYFAETAHTSFMTWVIAVAGGAGVLLLVGLTARIFAGSQTR